MLIKILAAGAVIGGFAATAAYVPQIIHLIKVKDSSGLSLSAWAIWLISNLLLLAYGISINNHPIIITQVLCSSSNLITLILALKYKRGTKNAYTN